MKTQRVSAPSKRNSQDTTDKTRQSVSHEHPGVLGGGYWEMLWSPEMLGPSTVGRNVCCFRECTKIVPLHVVRAWTKEITECSSPRLFVVRLSQFS